MKYPPYTSKRVVAILVTAAIVVATGLLESGRSHGRVTHANTPERSGANSSTSLADGTADLSAGQLNSIKIEPVGSYLFPVEKETGGSISFVDDLSVQVFPSYQGKIIKSLVRICPARAVAWRKAIGEHATTYSPLGDYPVTCCLHGSVLGSCVRAFSHLGRC
jgi:hypothetical protein